jgi:hypothetical protein
MTVSTKRCTTIADILHHPSGQAVRGHHSPAPRDSGKATSAANARALNNWLVNDWLAGYPYANVAVFDFYNVLTSSAGGSQSNDVDAEDGNHHRWWGGAVQHAPKRRTATSHLRFRRQPPSAPGTKATAEFVPCSAFTTTAGKPASLPPFPAARRVAARSQLLRGDEMARLLRCPRFKSQVLPLCWMISRQYHLAPGWQPFWDEGTPTTISCAPTAGTARTGAQALQIDFNVAADSWATCALFFDQPQDWSAWQGISFSLHASQPALVFDVDVYRNTPQGTETYLFTIEAPPDSLDGWAPVQITWEQLLRAAWEADPGTPLGAPLLIEGLAFGLSTYPDTPNLGGIWVDDLQFISEGEPQDAEPAAPAPAPTEIPTAVADATGAEPDAEKAVEPEPTGGSTAKHA